MLRVVDDVIAMHGLLWPDEIRASDEAAPEADVSVREAELDLADALMDTLGEVDMSTLHDDYRTAVEELIAAKADGAVPATETAPAGPGGKVIDLMAALENSVKAAKAARGEEHEGEGEGEGETVAEVTQLNARKSTARKAPAKKSASAKGEAAKAEGTAKSAPSKSTRSKSGQAKSSAQDQVRPGQVRAAGQAHHGRRSSTAKKSAAASPKSTGAKKSTSTTAKKTRRRRRRPKKRASA